MDNTCVRICEDGIAVTLNSELVESSPGIGILRDNQIITGLEAASEQFHLPQYTFKRFWKELNQKSLSNRNKNIRHNDKSNNKNIDTLLYVILGNHTLLLILLA